MTILVTPGGREAIRIVYEAQVPASLLPCEKEPAPSMALSWLDNVLGGVSCDGIVAWTPVSSSSSIAAIATGEADPGTGRGPLYVLDTVSWRPRRLGELVLDPNSVQDLTAYTGHGTGYAIVSNAYFTGTASEARIYIIDAMSGAVLLEEAAQTMLYKDVPVFDTLAGDLEPRTGIAGFIDYQSSYDATTGQATVSWDVVYARRGLAGRLSGTATFQAPDAPGEPELLVYKGGRLYALLGVPLTANFAVFLDLESGDAEVYQFPTRPDVTGMPVAAEPGVGVCYVGARAGGVECRYIKYGGVEGNNYAWSGSRSRFTNILDTVLGTGYVAAPPGYALNYGLPISVVDPARGILYYNGVTRLMLLEFR